MKQNPYFIQPCHTRTLPLVTSYRSGKAHPGAVCCRSPYGFGYAEHTSPTSASQGHTPPSTCTGGVSISKWLGMGFSHRYKASADKLSAFYGRIRQGGEWLPWPRRTCIRVIHAMQIARPLQTLTVDNQYCRTILILSTRKLAC